MSDGLIARLSLICKMVGGCSLKGILKKMLCMCADMRKEQTYRGMRICDKKNVNIYMSYVANIHLDCVLK
jgi:hypothetical protein